MKSLNYYINEYTTQLKKGQIQIAYKGIMTFMSGLKTHLEKEYPEFSTSALYFGYMDMTYFAFTPLELKQRKLKLAIVYLHEQNSFEVWLGAANKNIQTQYIEMLRHKNIENYQLSQALPGVDSIIEKRMVEQPDFDHPEELRQLMASQIMGFADDIISALNE